MLTVEKLQAGYGPAQVLFDVSFAVGAGEVVTLLGRNGMGKTTTIRTLMGLLPARGGDARFEGEPLLGKPPFRIAQRGLGLVPEGRQVFPTLSVEENLVATAAARHGEAKWTLPRVYEFFPRLAERRGNCKCDQSGGLERPRHHSSAPLSPAFRRRGARYRKRAECCRDCPSHGRAPSPFRSA